MRLELANDIPPQTLEAIKHATEDRTAAETRPGSGRQVMNFQGRVRDVGRCQRRTAEVRESALIGVAQNEPFESAAI